MKCERCKKRKATIHLSQDPKPGEIIRVDLCAKCAAVDGYDENDFSCVFSLLAAKIKRNSN
jgi:protein-arginine kinase activator protein McsA